MEMYANYYISLLYAVQNHVKSAGTKLPLQIDFWVMPKAVSESQEFLDLQNDDNKSSDDSEVDDDSESEEEDDPSESNATELNNLDGRLKFTDNLIKKEIDDKSLPRLTRTFCDTFDDVIKGQRGKRMVMLVDRRVDRKNVTDNDKNYGDLNDEEEKKCKDTLYAYLPKKSSDIPKGRYLNESMFNLSKLEVIPSENGKVEPPDQDSNAIHAVSSIPNLCILSVQIHEESVIRAYWYINGSCVRFFPSDMINVWPLYFIDKKSLDTQNEQRVRQSTERISQLIKENENNIPLKDTNFDEFWKTNTKIASAEQSAKR